MLTAPMTRFSSPTESLADQFLDVLDITTETTGGNPQTDLLAFTRSVFAGKYQTAQHHIKIAEHLQWVEDTPNAVLIVTMPPRHGKSTLISEHWPPYLLGRHPSWRIIATSAVQELANDFSDRAREIIGSERWPFPKIRLKRGQSRIQHWNIEEQLQNKRGGYSAAGAAGQLTGRGANVAIIDDPVKNFEEALSPTMRKKNWDWFTGTLFPRLESDGRLVVVGTRWHEDDLIGRIMEFAKTEPELRNRLRILLMPAIDENGYALWPDEWSLERLALKRAMVGEFNWRAQYMGEPNPEVGNILNPAWIPALADVAQTQDWYLQSWDTSYGESNESDYSVCHTYAVGPEYMQLVNIWRGRPTFPDLEIEAVRQWSLYHPRVVLIENKVSGISLQQALRRRHRKIPVRPVPVSSQEGKKKRANDISPFLIQGRVTVSLGLVGWNDGDESLAQEMRTFPNGKHDDSVDAMTQAVGYVYLPQNDGAGGRAVSRKYTDTYEQDMEDLRR